MTSTPVRSMAESIRFDLNGEQVEADPGETIWQVARRLGTEIPHLCHSPEPDYRPDGNCRACMVEIDGERVLAASCKRTPAAGMKVKSRSPRATAAQKMVLELWLRISRHARKRTIPTRNSGIGPKSAG